MDQETRAAILRAAIAAPSADNSQPWQFVWSVDTLDVRIDPDRSGGASDSRYVLSDLATGACVENILLRGRALGLAGDLDAFPDPADALWAARIRWRRASEHAAPDPLADAIDRRHCDRRFPWRGPIDHDTRTDLGAEAAAVPAARLWWPQTPQARRSATALIRRAEALRFRSDVLHAELFSSIRFDVGWHGACDEGLAPATLAVEAPARPLFQALRHPALMTVSRRLGAASMLGWRSASLPIRLSPGLCLIVVPSASRHDVFAGGRALERAWLAATRAGLSVQPYASAGVLSLGFVPVEPALRSTLARLAASLQELCGAGQGLVFLRLGRAPTNPPPRSGRRVPASFTASAQ